MSVPLSEIGAVFLRLGCRSFGGPVAHVGYLHEELVRRRGWLEEAAFADLVALSQFLPGPGSSQLVFALGMQRGGLLGALLASFCFTLPSALLMIGFAYGVVALGAVGKAGFLHGLKLAAVAVVAQAVWVMGRKLCVDGPRRLLALGVAGLLLGWPGAWAQVGLIVGGGVCGWLLYGGKLRRERGVVPGGHTGEGGGVEGTREGVLGGVQTSVESRACARGAGGSGVGRRHLWAVASLLVCLSLLVALPALAKLSGAKEWGAVDSFYRAGSLVFGGGHVVLPLLRAELVPTGLVGDEAFLAGYGAAQALPGPLFTFSGYLGTLIWGGGASGWVGGLLCLLAVFMPALLLMGGALPFWQGLRRRVWMQAALRGANAAVVGLLLAALYRPVGTEAIGSWLDLGVAALGLVALERLQVPSWLWVLLCAGLGQWVL